MKKSCVVFTNMSTRWYPIYRRGFPQRRVFLPNFWMRVVDPSAEGVDKITPKNQVTFEVSPEMTKHDVKNYLQQIYKVDVMDVALHIKSGKTYEHKTFGFLYKDDDVKLAFVALPKDQIFEFPDIVKVDEREKQMDQGKNDLKEAEKAFQKATKSNKWDRKGIPSFFGI